MDEKEQWEFLRAIGRRRAQNVTGSIDAGKIPPSTRRYVVTELHRLATLELGDIVVMVETPKMENCLLRLRDMTLHEIKDDCDQYVHLTTESTEPERSQ